MSKCSVTWCPAQGLDDGLLPGLCIEHRDEVLGKQEDAVVATAATTSYPFALTFADVQAITKADPTRIFRPDRDLGYVEVGRTTAPASPDVFSASDVVDNVKRTDGACGVLGCKNVGVRRGGKVRCPEHALQESAQAAATFGEPNPYKCRRCGHIGVGVKSRVRVHRAYTLFGIEPGAPLCDVCVVDCVKTPLT